MSDIAGSGATRFASQGLGSTYNHSVITNPPFCFTLTGASLVFSGVC